MMLSTRLLPTLPLLLASLLSAQLAVAEHSRAQAPRVDALFGQSLEAIKPVDSYQGRFVMRELIGDQLKSSKVDFKFMKPFKVYMKYITPSEGQEVLYVQGENDGELKAHKGSFPDITVNLNPRGRAAMKGSHQPIQTFGLLKQIEIMTRIYRKARARGDSTYTVSDGGIFLGEPVWKVEAQFPSTGDVVKVREDEDGNLWKFANRVGQTMYVILHYNGIRSPGSIDEGDEIFVPHHYGSRLRYLIGKKSLMPLQETSWDHEGRVYESYDYPVLKLNAGLTAKDFDPENEQYDF